MGCFTENSNHYHAKCAGFFLGVKNQAHHNDAIPDAVLVIEKSVVNEKGAKTRALIVLLKNKTDQKIQAHMSGRQGHA